MRYAVATECLGPWASEDLLLHRGGGIMTRIYARLAFLPSLIWDVVVCQWIRGLNRWDKIETGVLLGVMPSAHDVEQLAEFGVKGVVNTCEESCGPEVEYKRLGIEQLRIPTVDFTEPSLEHIKLAVEFIDRQRAESKSVYVHCKSGRGRSPTVVLCWLIQFHNLSPLEAFEMLRKRRPQVISGLNQRSCVGQFWSEIQAAAIVD